METRGFVWLDLETTGLDKKKDHVLEVAAIFTDFKLQHLSDYHTLIKSDMDRAQVDSFVLNMHNETGLWNRLDSFPWPNIHEVDNMLTDWIRNLKSIYDLSVVKLAGSSVGQFDMQFVERDFPTFRKELHYRVFDVSTLKELNDMCGGYIKEEKRYLPEHVAMNDVKNSLDYGRQFFSPFVDTSAYAEHTLKVLENE